MYKLLTIQEAEQRFPEMVKGQTWKGVHSKYLYLCDKHGQYTQEFNAHNKGHGCSKCAGEQRGKSQSLSIQEAMQRFPEMVKWQTWKGAHAKYWYICKSHGKYLQEFNNHNSGNGCTACGRVVTEASQRLTIEGVKNVIRT